MFVHFEWMKFKYECKYGNILLFLPLLSVNFYFLVLYNIKRQGNYTLTAVHTSLTYILSPILILSQKRN